MKILYVTTVGVAMSFYEKLTQQILDRGHSLDIATNQKVSDVQKFYHNAGCKVHQIDCSRSPLNTGNIRAIKQLSAIVEKGGYDIVHCHTPIAAACTRIACRKARKKGTKVIYTAHGFHFYKGAPKKNWMIFYPIEKICSYYTDVLLTINKEDHALAQKKLKAKKTLLVPGVGVDLERFYKPSVHAYDKRAQFGIPDGSFVIFSAGELNKNKDHETVIRAIAQIPNVYYVIAGRGELKEHLESVAETCGVKDRVILAGYRSDIDDLYKMSDIYALPSVREGLNVSVMEAMACGLPCVLGRIRGNVDLIDDGKGGAFFTPQNVDECKNAILSVLNGDMDAMGTYNTEKVKKYSLDTVNEIMLGLYGV